MERTYGLDQIRPNQLPTTTRKNNKPYTKDQLNDHPRLNKSIYNKQQQQKE